MRSSACFVGRSRRRYRVPRLLPPRRERGHRGIRTGREERVRILLEEEQLDLSLTDARYFRQSFTVPDMEHLEVAERALAQGAPMLLGVGLTRPFAPIHGDPERHWLQVNALHLASNPGLRLRQTWGD